MSTDIRLHHWDRIVRPTTPGEILLHEFMKPLGISPSTLATQLSIPSSHLNEILLGSRTVSPDLAKRLSTAFNTSPQFWSNLQDAVDLYDSAAHS